MPGLSVSNRVVGVVEAVEVVGGVEAVVAGLDVQRLSGDEAARLTGVFARAEHLAATAKALAAGRASDCGQWEQVGSRSAEQWLAGVPGSGEGAARACLALAAGLGAQPDLARACRAGGLSLAQAGEIAAAGEVNPVAVPGLVEVAGGHGWRRLREACRQVITAGRSELDDQARRAAVHQSRYLRTWMDRDGAGRLDARLSPDALARFRASLRPFQTQRFEMAREGGVPEKPECYAADALVALAATAVAAARGAVGGVGPDGVAGAVRADSGAGPAEADRARSGRRLGPPATVIALVDHAALVRGHVEGDECGMIKGVGPVPVATVRAMLDDAFLGAVVTDGVDIRSVVHMGRRPTALQATALWVRDRACAVPGCDVAEGLEAHHLGGGWSATRSTSLDDLALLCAYHHDLASYRGWTLIGPPGQWAWRPPPGGVLPGPFDDGGLDLAPPPSVGARSGPDAASRPAPSGLDAHPLGLFGP